jgi:hypothetical protein
MFWFILEELVPPYEYAEAAAWSGNHVFNLGKIKGSGTVAAVLTTKQCRFHHVAFLVAVDPAMTGSSIKTGIVCSKITLISL